MTCPICLEGLGACHALECGHEFHAECIVGWFRSGKNTCPLCKDKGSSLDDISLPQTDKMKIMRKYSKTNGGNAELIKVLIDSYDSKIEQRIKVENEQSNLRLKYGASKQNNDVQNIQVKKKTKKKRLREIKKQIGTNVLLLNRLHTSIIKRRRLITSYPIEQIIIPVKKFFF